MPFLFELRQVQHYLRGIYTGDSDADAVCQHGAAGNVPGGALRTDAEGDGVRVLQMAAGEWAYENRIKQIPRRACGDLPGYCVVKSGFI